MEPGNEELLYLLGHVAEQIATDERTHALDVTVQVTLDAVVLTGVVGCEARRSAVEEVVREHIPSELKLTNRLRIASYLEPSSMEPVN